MIKLPSLRARKLNSVYFKNTLLLGVCIGIISGVGAIFFHELLDVCMKFMLETTAEYDIPGCGLKWTLPPPPGRPWLIPVITTLGGLVTGLIVFSFAPETKGHGTDAAIASFHKYAGRVRGRVPLIKMIASAITIGSGGSAGREGPMAQISAGFGSMVASFLHLGTRYRRLATAIGIGAGIGTIFKAPLGGALFSAEVLYHDDYEVEALIPAFIASIVGYSIFGSYSGWDHIFSIPPTTFHHPPELLCYAVLGVACALVGIAYVRTFYYAEELFEKIRIPNHLKPAIGGLLIGILGLSFPQVLEMGYGWIVGLMYNKFPILALNGSWLFPRTWEEGVAWLFLIALLKILATAVTIGSGGSGGVFAPGLVIGALVGNAVGNLFVNILPSLVLNKEEFIASSTLIGMMALFGGISKAPIATLIMVSEMTGSYEIIPPAMLAIAISYMLTGKNAIYSEQVPNRAYSPAHIREYNVDVLERIYVRDVMNTEVPALSPDMTVSEALRIMMSSRMRGLPVVRDEKVIGMLAFEDVMHISPESRRQIKIKEVMSKKVIKVTPNETLASALRKLIQHNVAQLPVVDPEDPMKLIGIICRSDILKAHDILMSQLDPDAEY